MSSRIIVVQGVVKFFWKVDNGKLQPTDPDFKQLYLNKEFREEERQISKYRAKMEWFRSDRGIKDEQSSGKRAGWRRELVGVWKGSNNAQKPALESGFSTVLSVPNTANAELARSLINSNPGLAKLTKYSVKLVEKSGINKQGKTFRQS